MIHIAIVDDEMIDLVTAENFLRQFMKEFYPQEASEIRIDTYSRGEDIMAACGQLRRGIEEERRKQV